MITSKSPPLHDFTCHMSSPVILCMDSESLLELQYQQWLLRAILALSSCRSSPPYAELLVWVQLECGEGLVCLQHVIQCKYVYNCKGMVITAPCPCKDSDQWNGAFESVRVGGGGKEALNVIVYASGQCSIVHHILPDGVCFGLAQSSPKRTVQLTKSFVPLKVTLVKLVLSSCVMKLCCISCGQKSWRIPLCLTSVCYNHGWGTSCVLCFIVTSQQKLFTVD